MVYYGKNEELKKNMDNNQFNHYKTELESVILDEKLHPNNNPDIEKYINLLSLYMKYSNDAYKYNLPYLGLEYEKFKAFLNSAIKKVTILKQIVYKIRLIDEVKQQPNLPLSIEIDSFLVANLNNEIHFAEPFSLVDAEQKNSLVTIALGQKVRTFKVEYLEDDQKHNEVVKLIKDLLKD